MRFHGLLFLAAAALAVSGCRSTMKDVFNSKTEGRSAVYPVSPKKALEITGDVLWEATHEYPEAHLDYHFLCVKGGMGTDETLIGVWCEPQEDPEKARVTVVVRRQNGLQVATVLTEEQFHDNFARTAGVKRLP
jgi:hypothetical protein